MFKSTVDSDLESVNLIRRQIRGTSNHANRLAEKLGIGPDTRVIDIACGKGTTSAYLANRFGCEVVGIDISDDLLDEAKAIAARKGLEDKLDFRVGDALDLPFADGEFDVAISQAMLILVGDKQKAIREAMRVMRPGGRSGWLELSWKKQPPAEFMHEVSDVICAYCMTNVETFENWEKVFSWAGVENLEVEKHSQDMSMGQMFSDEGLYNSIRVMSKYAGNSRVRKRMKTLNEFINSHQEYFGYGIYVGSK